MGVYTDGQGNHYLGDLQFGNHEIAYPDQYFLKSDQDFSDLVTNLTTWLNNAGWNITSMSDQSVLTDMVNKVGNNTFSFGVKRPSDLNERYVFYVNGFFAGTGNSSLFVVKVNGDQGQQFLVDTPASRSFVGWTPPGDTPISFFGVVNDHSISFGFCFHNLATNQSKMYFAHAGELENVNTNLNYYSSDPAYSRILWWASTGNWSVGNTDISAYGEGSHVRPNMTAQDFYMGIETHYPINCNDGQTETSQWSTYAIMFDNDAVKSYPGIGTLSNILAGIGDYVGGKPIRIGGIVQPSNGYVTYLPISPYNGKTILVRCYSSGLSD